MSETRRTPLYEEHLKLGGKVIDFAGWDLPVQYEGIRAEHLYVRKHVGMFDVSHMGQFRIKGEKALETLEWLTTNHVAKLENGEAQYTLLPNDKGGLVDDLIIYCIEKGVHYMACVNAANIEKDFDWMNKHNKGADMTNESDEWGLIALQGDETFTWLDKVFPEHKWSEMPAFTFAHADFNGRPCMVAKTGYTGEPGVEIFSPNEQTAALWSKLLEVSEGQIHPVGLGARDTLRLEMKYSLYGHEINDETNPYEAGLGWVVKPKLKDFLGKDKIMAYKEAGLKKKLVGFKMKGRGIPRQDYKLFSGDQEIGFVTSGTMSPSLGEAIGIGYVNIDFSKIGVEFEVEIRQKRVLAEVVSTPFVAKS